MKYAIYTCDDIRPLVIVHARWMAVWIAWLTNGEMVEVF